MVAQLRPAPVDESSVTPLDPSDVLACATGDDGRMVAVWTPGTFLKAAARHRRLAEKVADPVVKELMRRDADELVEAVEEGDIAWLQSLVDDPAKTDIDIAPRMLVADYSGGIDVRWVAPVLRAPRSAPLDGRLAPVARARGRAPRRRRSRSTRGSPGRKSEPHQRDVTLVRGLA